MAKYRKVDPRIWNDRKFRPLSDDAKLVLFFLLTNPSLTAVGAMRGTIPGMAAEMAWDQKRFQKAFGELSKNGMANHDETACFVGLPNFLKYNRPDNPNQLKAWLGAWDMLPECPLKDQLFQRLRRLAEQLGEQFAKPFTELFEGGLPNGMANQEQEQELKQEVEECVSSETQSASASAKTRNGKPKRTRHTYSDAFERFWAAYPPKRRRDKSETFQRFKVAAQALVDNLGTTADAERYLIQRASDYADSHAGQSFPKQPAVWLNDGCWEDSAEAWADWNGNGKKQDEPRDLSADSTLRAPAHVQKGKRG